MADKPASSPPRESLSARVSSSGSGGNSRYENETEEAFNMRMSESIRQAFVSMAISMGSQLGLFEYLANLSQPQTCQEIASAMNYKEKYVHEWLGSMTCAHIVEVTDEGEERFWLPKYRHKALVGHHPQNVSHFMRMVPMCANVLSEVMKCFKLDGPAGTDWSMYPEYHEIRNDRMKSKRDIILKNLLYDAPGVISKLEEGIQVLEIGSSTGILAFEMARLFPKSTIVGSDICRSDIEAAEQKARETGVSNLSFQVQDCTAFPQGWTDKWDLIFASDVFHDLPRTDLGFSESFRVLRKGGVLLFNDIPLHTGIRLNRNIAHADFSYAVGMLACVPMSLAGEGGMGLGPAWGQELALSMLRDAGFKNPQIINKNTIDYMAVKE